MAGPARPRFVVIDMARTAALVAMAVFHFTFDLEFFGFIDQGTTTSGGWAIFARAIAGGFLFLAGVSLVLGHGRGIRWHPFLRRLLMIGAAAALVSLATRIAMPEAWIFFGILHSIAVASVIGLLFLRLPAPVTLLAAAFALHAPRVLRDDVFDAPWLWWTGLSTFTPRSMDFEPVFPWVAPFLFGLAAARLAERAGVWRWLASRSGAPTAWQRVLAWPGRHSLVVYLVHQPVLMGLVGAAAMALR